MLWLYRSLSLILFGVVLFPLLPMAIVGLFDCCRKKNEFTRLWDKKNTMMSKHSKELENFSTCLERLKQIPLHPALKREGSGAGSPTPFQHTGNGTTPSPPVGSQPPPQPSRQTLWDCVPVAKLQSWASDCRERYRLIGATYAGTWHKTIC